MLFKQSNSRDSLVWSASQSLATLATKFLANKITLPSSIIEQLVRALRQ
jgi:hypothetical protein